MIAVTPEMIDAAESAYDEAARAAEQDQCDRRLMTIALRAAVDAAGKSESVALEPESPTVPVMTRAEALLKAQEMVDHLSQAPTKANGYPLDGYRPPSLEERATQVLRLAAFMINGSAQEES